MGTAYTGIAAHVNIANPVAITVLADGDADAAASFNPGLQALADYAEALRTPPNNFQIFSPGTGWVRVGADPTTSYWKDASGIVHMKGRMGPSAGSGPTMFTLPPGFRPILAQQFVLAYSGGTVNATVDTDGTVTLSLTPAVGQYVWLAPISFLAEA